MILLTFLYILVTQTTPHTPTNTSDNSTHVVALPAGRSGLNNFRFCLDTILSGKKRLRWTVNLPVWFPADVLHLGSNGGSQMFSPRRPKLRLALPQTQPEVENVLSVNSLCSHPALRERTLRRLVESGDLQALIDQWEQHSSLEELEAFIDDYFETIWERTMQSCRPAEPEQETVPEDADEGREDVLTTIERKLSKLELLEEIRTDLKELRTSLERSWTVIQELQEKCKEEERKSEDTGESKME